MSNILSVDVNGEIDNSLCPFLVVCYVAVQTKEVMALLWWNGFEISLKIEDGK